MKNENAQHYLPGIKPVLELLRNEPEKAETVYLRKGRRNKDFDEIMDLCRKEGVKFQLMDASLFQKQVPDASQGVAVRLFEAGFVDSKDIFNSIMDAPLPLVVVLDQVNDPGNAGTLARTLFALGGAGLIIPRHNSVFLGAGARRAAAGALEKLPVAMAGSLTQTIDEALEMGINVYGAAASDSAPEGKKVENILDFSPYLPAVLILGSEESGIRPVLLKRCQTILSIPMLRDFDSINVAQAGAICIASFLRSWQNK